MYSSSSSIYLQKQAASETTVHRAGPRIRFVRLILEKCIIPAENFGFMPSELLLDIRRMHINDD